MCQALNVYVNGKKPYNLEECEYAACWRGSEVKPTTILKVEEDKTKLGGSNWDPLEHLPPPCNPPPEEVPLQEGPLPQGEEVPLRVENPQPCCRVTRSRIIEERGEEKLFPLREVPLGGVQGGIGFVNVPLNSTEVRSF